MATPTNSNNPVDLQAQLATAVELSDPGISRFYFNGFSVTIGPSDLTLLFKQFDQAVGLGACSLPIAKDLVKLLTEHIDLIEKALGNPILSNEEGIKRMTEHQAGRTP